MLLPAAGCASIVFGKFDLGERILRPRIAAAGQRGRPLLHRRPQRTQRDAAVHVRKTSQTPKTGLEQGLRAASIAS